MTSRRPAVALVLAALTLALAAIVPPGPAAAQPADEEDDGPRTDVRLFVPHLSGVLGPGSGRVASGATAGPGGNGGGGDVGNPPELDLAFRVLVENGGDAPVESLRLVVELHPAVVSRAQLRAALDGELDSNPQHVLHDGLVHDGAPLAPGTVAGVADRLPPERIAWGDGGVFPLRIAAVRGTEVVAEVVTAVVWLARSVAEPLLATLVVPFTDAPWRTASGAYPDGVDHEIQPGGRLDVLLRALERRPDASVVLAPSAHLLEDLRDRADGFTSLERQGDGTVESHLVDPEDPPARLANDVLQRLRAVGRQLPFPPVTGTYAEADLAALLAGDDPTLTELAAEAASAGRRRLPLLLDRTPDAATHLVGSQLDPEVLDLLPGDQLLLPADTVVQQPAAVLDRNGAAGPLRSPSGRVFTGLVADPDVSASLAGAPTGAGAVVDVQRPLAETAVAWFAGASLPGRTIVLRAPDTWDPGPEVVDRLLQELEDAAWLRLLTPSQQAVLGRRATDTLELRPPEGGGLEPAFASALASASQGLSAARSALPEEETTLAGRTPDDLQDALLRSTSAWFRTAGPGEPDALVRDVQRTIDETFGEVVVASGSRVTLTSDTGQIPVTLQRTRGGPLAIRVEVASQGRLVWPEGQRSDTLILTEGAAQTVTFPTRALSPGTFTVAVRVTDPSGAHTLERTTLSVRSAAISGPALSVTGFVVLLLLLLGALRRRDPDRRHLTVVDDPDDDDPSSVRRAHARQR